MSEVTTRIVTTIGQLELQEVTTIQSSDLKRGDFIRLKASKPANAKPYGYAEVLAVVQPGREFKIRRFN